MFIVICNTFMEYTHIISLKGIILSVNIMGIIARHGDATQMLWNILVDVRIKAKYRGYHFRAHNNGNTTWCNGKISIPWNVISADIIQNTFKVTGVQFLPICGQNEPSKLPYLGVGKK